jgi:SAM-dependent methyltransferase
VSCTDDLLVVGCTVARSRPATRTSPSWLARQQALACWRYLPQATSARWGPGAPEAPRGAREALDATAGSWQISTRSPTEIPEGPELLPQLGETFDTVFSVNVLQFLRERAAVLHTIRSVLKPNGLVATTVQPRHRGATAEDAQAFARRLSKELIDAGFREVTVSELDLKPIPAVCVLARK